jgi:hypothetical protein
MRYCRNHAPDTSLVFDDGQRASGISDIRWRDVSGHLASGCGRQILNWEDLGIEKKKRPESRLFPKYVAERVGFEPTVRETRTLDFESSAFDHSATFPASVCLQRWALQSGEL